MQYITVSELCEQYHTINKFILVLDSAFQLVKEQETSNELGCVHLAIDLRAIWLTQQIPGQQKLKSEILCQGQSTIQGFQDKKTPQKFHITSVPWPSTIDT